MGYKMKTNSAAKKRFKVTATGKVKYRRAFGRHNLGKVKKQSTKRKYRKLALIHKTNMYEMPRLLPYMNR